IAVDAVHVEPDDLERAADGARLDDAGVHADLHPRERVARGGAAPAGSRAAVRDQVPVDGDVSVRRDGEALRAPHVRALVLLAGDGAAADRGDLAAVDLELDEALGRSVP